jgi:nucleoside-diphosphate-sugar epimerase
VSRATEHSSRVLIIGAGWVGSAAAVRLARRGNPVVATTRSGRAAADEPAIEWRAYDSARDDGATLSRLIGDADVVVVCWAPSGRDVDRRLHYVGGAAKVVDACAAHRPSRLIYTSSTSALPAVDADLDESCEQWPDNERGRIQREAEETIRSGCERLAIPWTVLRLAGLYGPGRGLERIYRWEDGKPLAGDGSAPTNMVHLDDVCQAIEAAVDLPAGVCGIVHVCDDDHSTRRRAFADLARRQGRAAPEWELPEGPPRGKRVCNGKLKETLSVRLLHPRHTPPT